MGAAWKEPISHRLHLQKAVMPSNVSALDLLILLMSYFFATGCKPDTFEPTLCYIASISNHQEQELLIGTCRQCSGIGSERQPSKVRNANSVDIIDTSENYKNE